MTWLISAWIGWTGCLLGAGVNYELVYYLSGTFTANLAGPDISDAYFAIRVSAMALFTCWVSVYAGLLIAFVVLLALTFLLSRLMK